MLFLNWNIDSGLMIDKQSHVFTSCCLFVDPVDAGWCPVHQFVFLEPQSDLLVGGLNRVGSVDDVASDLNAEVTADGSRGGVGWIGGSKHDATGLDDIQALPDHWDNGAG